MNTPKLSPQSVCGTLLMFILCMTVYYSKDNKINILYMPTMNYSIEKALEQIPICTPHDRSRQRSLLTTFHAWTLFAHQHHIQYWIAYGTLVGYVQRGGLLPHDHDTDILMLAQDTRHLVPFSDTNFSSIHELKIHPQWSYVGYANRSYFPSQGFNFIAPNGRFKHRQLGYHVDIWPTYDYHPDQSRNTTNVNKTLTEYNTSYRWLSTPVRWTFPLQPCIFSGIQTWCPAMPKSVVTMMYGLAAVNKTDTRCVNNTWIRR